MSPMMRPLQAHLRAFFETGNLGPIFLEMKLKQVLSFLGDPDESTARTRNSILIHRYGDFEFTFAGDEQKLKMVDLYHFEATPTGGPKIELDPWIIRAELPLTVFEAELKSANIPFGSAKATGTSAGDSDGTTRLWCGPGIELIFIDQRTQFGPAPGFHGAFLKA